MVELHRRINSSAYLNSKHYAQYYAKNTLPGTYNLEHIMPKEWEQYWQTVQVKPVGGRQGYTQSQLENCRNAHIKEIGNMTLLEHDHNDILANYDFRTKVEGGSPVPTGRQRKVATGTFVGMQNGNQLGGQLGITWFDIVKPYTKENKTTWDEARIRERTASLTKDVLELWPRLGGETSQEPDEAPQANTDTSIDLSQNTPDIGTIDSASAHTSIIDSGNDDATITPENEPTIEYSHTTATEAPITEDTNTINNDYPKNNLAILYQSR